jgi:multidrug efflux pump
MTISAPFIKRPIATTLLTAGAALAGALAFLFLPVAPLPQVDFPTISVQASMPGASPETMATSVATPLERHLGQIADVTEMTSQSTLGNTRITLQFGLDRDIDGAARDVQAGIAAARADLPVALKTNPIYRKINPADAPIMILALTSDTLPIGQIYDAASTILAQKLSQVQGVGQVNVGGGSLPAVRVDLNPRALFHYGIGLEDVRSALAATNAHSPKGAVEDDTRHFQIYANDQARRAADYRDLVIAWRNGAPVRLSDVADVSDGVEDLRNQGLFNGKRSVVVIITKQPGSNIVETVNRIKSLLPQLKASIPGVIDSSIVMDRTTTIRASLRDVERALCISVALVVLVVFLFLRNGRATIIPSIAVPVSLIGTFGAMYLMGYSLDNLSLMAMTVATGFVVDDAIVVLENIARHVEAGMPRFKAALLGAQEVGFTVVSMSLSLIAVFAPILLMGGIVGRLFREFAVTLSAAILISLAISLTTTPMMCARLLRRAPKRAERRQGFLARFYRACEYAFAVTRRAYDRALVKALHHEFLVLMIFFLTIGLNIYLFVVAPKGFFPQQDTGQLNGSVQADQSISFQSMQKKMVRLVDIVKTEPAVAAVAAFTGGGQTNSGNVFVSLKPLAERHVSADMVIGRLRSKVAEVAGAALYLQASQDIRMGGRQSAAQYQYSLQADHLADLRAWAPKLTEALKNSPILADVNSDQQDGGLESDLSIDRDAAARLGLTAAQIDNTLYDAFGQRQVSVIYNPLNQYHVIMEAAPEFWQSPETLREFYVEPQLAPTSVNVLTSTTPATSETMIPLSAIASFGPGKTPLAVNHQGHFAASTISFNLAAGKSLSDATTAIEKAKASVGLPASIHGGFQGTAQVFQQSLANEPILVLAALLAVYIVLGILYESYIHPLTILSTLPSAGVGALLALRVFQIEFSIMALIGVILLIGIVKKNAIMMIDVALQATREGHLDSRAAIYRACLMRFRPIMMTTMAAMFGALPLAIGFGEGAELRRPLGIAIVGGLLVSQLLTLFTTPVIYLYLDRLRVRFGR